MLHWWLTSHSKVSHESPRGSSAAHSKMEENEREPDSERFSAPPQTSQQQTTKETSAEELQTDEDDMETMLDISSDKFDPLLALYSPKIPLPYPNIKCFNNIAEYESFMKGGRGRAKPENVEKKLRKAQKGKADPERIERLKRLMVNNPVTEEGEGSGARRAPRQRKVAKNVLTRMPLHAGSPLGELNRCVQDKIRVKVHIRTFKGLRGVCSGFVVAFDKFWNLAMVDVDETYREPLLGQALYHEKALTITRLFDKLKVQEAEALRESKEEKRFESEPGSVSSQVLEKSRTQSIHCEEKSKCSLKGKRVSKVSQKSENKPRVDYGRVHTRHVNQLFVRGENVVLVNITQG